MSADDGRGQGQEQRQGGQTQRQGAGGGTTRKGTLIGFNPQRYTPQGLISRVADSCFWFGRYVERAESTARHMRATLHLAIDGELSPRQAWHPALIVAGEEGPFTARHGDEAVADGEAVQRHLVWDDQCIVSLIRSVSAARENARAIRDVLSSDVWEYVNELHLWLHTEAAEAQYRTQRDGFYRHVRQLTQLILGLLRSTMLHDMALDFIWLGVMLERANQTARLLDVHHHAFAEMEEKPGPAQGIVETAVWLALLRALSGVEPFMKTHPGRVTGEAVARFLVSDGRFPRSISYCVHAAHDRFKYLRPEEDEGLPGGESLARFAQLDRWVQSLGADGRDPTKAPGGLHAILTAVVNETATIAETIGRELLGYGGAEQ